MLQKAVPAAAAPSTNLLDLDDIFGGSSSNAIASAHANTTAQTSGVDLLADIFAPQASTPQQQLPIPPANSLTGASTAHAAGGAMDLFNNSSGSGGFAPPAAPSFVAFEKVGLR